MKCKLMSLGLLWLRVLTGAGIAYHGYGKIFGGGMGKFAGFVGSLGVPFPEVMAWAAALSEFGGGILIAIGLLTRPAAFFIFATMTVAAFGAHGQDPFQKKEMALLYWTIAGALMMTGAGAFSFDHKHCRLEKKLRQDS